MQTSPQIEYHIFHFASSFLALCVPFASFVNAFVRLSFFLIVLFCYWHFYSAPEKLIESWWFFIVNENWCCTAPTNFKHLFVQDKAEIVIKNVMYILTKKLNFFPLHTLKNIFIFSAEHAPVVPYSCQWLYTFYVFKNILRIFIQIKVMVKSLKLIQNRIVQILFKTAKLFFGKLVKQIRHEFNRVLQRGASYTDISSTLRIYFFKSVNEIVWNILN